MAALLANGFAKAYIEQNLNRRMEMAMEAFEWLRKQAEEYRIRVEQGRMALHDYRKETRTIESVGRR